MALDTSCTNVMVSWGMKPQSLKLVGLRRTKNVSAIMSLKARLIQTSNMRISKYKLDLVGVQDKGGGETKTIIHFSVKMGMLIIT
jgi:hypothetical protein